MYIYSWELLGENPIIIRGHGLGENNSYVHIDKSYEHFCYYETRTLSGTRGSVQASTSEDISTMGIFKKQYSKNRRELRGHMSEISLIASFTAAEKISYCGFYPSEESKNIPCPLILSFDIETSTPNTGMPVPYLETDKVEMIGCIFQRYKSSSIEKFVIHLSDYKIVLDDVTSLPCSDELAIIDKFFGLIADMNPDVITGFNIYGFDLDFIVSKLRYYMHYTTMCSRPSLKHMIVEPMDWQSSAYGHNRYNRIRIPGRVIFDIMLYFKRFKLEKYSLGHISETFLEKGKKDLSYEDMAERFRKREDLNEVADYCLVDSLLVLELFNKFNIWTELCESSAVMRCDIEDLYTRGEQLKITNQIIKECIDREVILVKREVGLQKDYQGAAVLEPVIGIHENCTVLDFASLYPSIIIAFNVCPSTVKSKFNKRNVGLFPSCIKNLLSSRKAVKKTLADDIGEGKLTEIEKIVLDKKQNALKICANSMYGVMGFASNKYFGSIECAEKVTKIGRESLIEVSKFIQGNYDCEIIYGDTDSFMIKFPKSLSREGSVELSRRIASDVSDLLPDPMTLNFEDYFDKMILLSKKRYIMAKGPVIKYKGVMIARRGYCRFAKDLYKEVILKIASGDSPDIIESYINKSMVRLLSGQVPMDQLSMTKSVKDIDDYKVDAPQVLMAKRLVSGGAEVTAGTRLEYVFVESESTRQGDKMYTPEEVRTMNLKIDNKYYIKTQVANQLRELISLMPEISINWF